jgi:3-hydroxybutyrate dehydrogenase
MLTGKNAIVTGSTSGIGLAIAHSLAAEGCGILLNGFADKATVDGIVNELQDKYKVKVDYSPADVTKSADVKAMIEMGERIFGSVDILVNNAGIQFTAPLDEFPDDKWSAIIATNLSSAFYGMKAALPGMKKRNWGRIICTASVHGLVASENKAAYVAAKHGIVGLTKVAALENAASGITVNAICPGWVLTPLVQKQIEDKAKQEGKTVEQAKADLLGEKQPNKKFVLAENIGGMVVFLCSEHADSMTGEIITMDGGWTAQ